MPFIKVKSHESFDMAMRRFRRACDNAGVVAHVRSKEFYEKPTWVRKRKSAAAVKRHHKNLGMRRRLLGMS